MHCTEGIGIWQWASNDQAAEPDVVIACCGDTPTLEILAAVSILRTHLPELKIRVINVVDLMKLQSSSEHPHGLSDTDYDSLFTTDKHIIPRRRRHRRRRHRHPLRQGVRRKHPFPDAAALAPGRHDPAGRRHRKLSRLYRV